MPRSSSSKQTNHNRNILVVDDDEHLINFLTATLSKHFTVTVAHNGREALKLFHQQMKIDLIITDLIMPQLDGFMLVTEVRKISHIPIIVMSEGTLDSSSMDYLQTLPINHFICKPFTSEALLKKLENITYKQK